METYRKSIESHFLPCEKTGSSIQEEVETSIYDTGAEFGCEDVAYDEDEGETSTYYLPGTYESRRSLKSVQKKHKNGINAYTQRAIEIGTDLPYAHYSTGAHPSVLSGSRYANLNVGTVPTRRLRTASRQRVVSPFAVATGTVQALAKTDAASSGDTNSFQDDQYTLHAGSQFQKSMEGESVGDFEKQLPYDCGETSVKRQKKKPKNLGSGYDQGWQLDYVVLSEHRDQSKKTLDSHDFESNENSGLYGKHNVKKQKMTKQSLETFDNISPINNSIPNPAASQMRQPGSGSSWTLFEDQALAVLVHDMGPNWEFCQAVVSTRAKDLDFKVENVKNETSSFKEKKVPAEISNISKVMDNTDAKCHVFKHEIEGTTGGKYIKTNDGTRRFVKSSKIEVNAVSNSVKSLVQTPEIAPPSGCVAPSEIAPVFAERSSFELQSQHVSASLSQNTTVEKNDQPQSTPVELNASSNSNIVAETEYTSSDFAATVTPQGPVASHDQPHSISMEFHATTGSDANTLIKGTCSDSGAILIAPPQSPIAYEIPTPVVVIQTEMSDSKVHNEIQNHIVDSNNQQQSTSMELHDIAGSMTNNQTEVVNSDSTTIEIYTKPLASLLPDAGGSSFEPVESQHLAEESDIELLPAVRMLKKRLKGMIEIKLPPQGKLWYSSMLVSLVWDPIYLVCMQRHLVQPLLLLPSLLLGLIMSSLSCCSLSSSVLRVSLFAC
ncbi:hypothetical protein KIW84_023296 [Lathyrus oleraceus]|uniref:Myb-like domain-containing protein n=1 Tax=Pisum sativum TaxID=3888 RepID=A0A9D4YCL6_PEA|nr:hypothetical protein KIW84_023296 [Pisum sativum]